MVTLFSPSDRRDSPQTRREMESLFQDAVRTDYASRSFQLTSALPLALEKSLAEEYRRDLRPWRADTRLPGLARAREQGEPQGLVREAIYGMPTEMRATRVREYPASSPGEVLAARELAPSVPAPGSPLGSPRLIVQVGEDLHEALPGRPGLSPAQDLPIGSGPGYVVGAENERTIRALGYEHSPGPVEVAFSVEEGRVRIPGAGVFEVRARAQASAIVRDGEDISALPHVSERGYLYSGGKRLLYDVSPEGTLSFGPAVADAPEGLSPEVRARLFYAAEITGRVRGGAGRPASYDLSPFIRVVDRVPRKSDVEVERVFEGVAEMPTSEGIVRCGRDGIIGEVDVGVRCRGFLSGRFHVAALSEAGELVVVEPDSRRVRLRQQLALDGEEPISPTFTGEGELGVVTRSGSGFSVWAVRPAPRGTAGQVLLFDSETA